MVRAETLRFKEEGVFGVVKDVFLPWYNAYRCELNISNHCSVARQSMSTLFVNLHQAINSLIKKRIAPT